MVYEEETNPKYCVHYLEVVGSKDFLTLMLNVNGSTKEDYVLFDENDKFYYFNESCFIDQVGMNHEDDL